MSSVCFVAAPLVARTGVYRSAYETVAEGRRQGRDWTVVLGVSKTASAAAMHEDETWIDEFSAEPAGLRGVAELRKTLLQNTRILEARWIVSLNPQTDMALAATRLNWISYLRGLPWPGVGEASALRASAWRRVETLSLRRAKAVWATTTTLQREVLPWVQTQLVPAGIRRLERTWDGRGTRNVAVWAARYELDKNPDLFVEIIRQQRTRALRGQMYGSGPLGNELRGRDVELLRVGDFVPPHQLWIQAMAYVGTSHREAFGRSAVEAAMNGIPTVLSAAFGAADLLYTDPDLRKRFVLDIRRVNPWVRALEDLARDEGLRIAVSEHVYNNAQKLTVGGSVAAIGEKLDALR